MLDLQVNMRMFVLYAAVQVCACVSRWFFTGCDVSLDCEGTYVREIVCSRHLSFLIYNSVL